MQTPLKVPNSAQPFLVAFLIQTALAALATYVSGTKLAPNVKALALKWIADGNALIALI